MAEETLFTGIRIDSGSLEQFKKKVAIYNATHSTSLIQSFDDPTVFKFKRHVKHVLK